MCSYGHWDILIKTQVDALFEELTYNRLAISSLDFKNEIRRRLDLIDPAFNTDVNYGNYAIVNHPVQQREISDYLREKFTVDGGLGDKDYHIAQVALPNGEFYFIYKPLPDLVVATDITTDTVKEVAEWEETVCDAVILDSPLGDSPFELSNDEALDAWMNSEIPATSTPIVSFVDALEEAKINKAKSEAIKKEKDQVHEFDDDDIIIHE